MTRRMPVGALGIALLLAAGCKESVPESANLTGTKSVAAAAPAPINPQIDNCNTTLPTEPVTPAIATSGLPCSLGFSGNANFETLQQAFDFNSWLTFVALSAPASGGKIGADAPTVWEGWQDLFSLMLPNGAAPPPFGSTVPPPAICRGAGPDSTILRMISKTPVTPTLSVAGEPLNTGPLIDQNGHYVRYQIVVNRPMYEYIVQNGLYSKAGQQKFAGQISFPVGDTVKGTTGTVGAIVVKAAWKVLDSADPNDDPAGFHVTRNFVYTAAAPGIPESCSMQTLGLVGLHIVHKTQSETQWIWSTFEHVDNAPDSANPPSAGTRYNFFRPGCSAKDCPPNRQPPQPWNPSADPFPKGFRSQIVRSTKYPSIATKSAAMWNQQFHRAIPAGVWQNYRLITTQWPTDSTNKTDPDGVPFPVFAANTTMETYVQGNVPQASSSCMSCHGNATGTAGRPSDFSFVLEKAN